MKTSKPIIFSIFLILFEVTLALFIKSFSCMFVHHIQIHLMGMQVQSNSPSLRVYSLFLQSDGLLHTPVTTLLYGLSNFFNHGYMNKSYTREKMKMQVIHLTINLTPSTGLL
jgi:hypothetical protein